MSSDMRHERIEELLAVRALGGLDGDDIMTLERELASHGECAECRRLEDEFAATAAMLADALDPEPVDEAMADAILAADGPARLVAVPDSPAVLRGERDVVAPRRTRSSWRTAVGLAAVFALIMIAGGLGIRTGRAVQVGAAAMTQRIARFEGDGGHLFAAYTPGQSGAVLFGSGLPQGDAGSVYEIWTITGDRPTSAGCTSSADGAMRTSVDADVSGADVLAITIERSTCPAAPTQAPILTATVAATA